MTSLVTFKKNTPTAKTTGGSADSYSTLATTWGFLQKKSGGRNLTVGDLGVDDSYVLIIDHIQDIEDNLRSDLKVTADGRTFAINSWEKVEEKRFYLKFNLSTRQQ